jgi:hypothetical protein
MPHLTAQIAFSTTFKTWLPLLHYLQRLEAMDISKNLEKHVQCRTQTFFLGIVAVINFHLSRTYTLQIGSRAN